MARSVHLTRMVGNERDKPFDVERRGGRICLRGELVLDNGAGMWRDVQAAAHDALRDRYGARLPQKIEIDLSNVALVDGAAVALLIELRAMLEARGASLDLVGASEHVAELVAVYEGRGQPEVAPEHRRHSVIVEIGTRVGAVLHGLRAVVELVGASVIGGLGVLARPMTGNFRSALPLMARAGTDAIPLVLLLNFLVGFVMGYESSRQLVRYGAEIFVADVVGIAVTRELSPILTSIIVLGRSAAAYAAELGTMKVSDELDALRTMGLDPIRHLVLPRLLTLFLVTPLLTLLGDVAGVTGGALVASSRLGVTFTAYLTELRLAVVPIDLAAGLIKASVAGVTMAIIGCAQGLAASGGPAGVGARTTSTVVKSLVALVLIDTFFAILIQAV